MAFLSPCILQNATRLPTSQEIVRGRCPPRCGSDPGKKNAQVEAHAMAAAGATLILKHATKAFMRGGRRPAPVAMRESILQLEQIQKANKASVDLDKLIGQWRLVFITPKKKPSMFNSLYFPFRAHQTFSLFPNPSTSDACDDNDVEIGEFDNAVFLLWSALYFRVIGPMRFIRKHNRLEFSVDRLKVKIGPFEWVKDGLDKNGYSLKGRRVSKLPFFTFFSIRDDIAVARGRSGGLALYGRVRDDERL